MQPGDGDLRVPPSPLGLIVIVPDESADSALTLLKHTFEAARFATLQLAEPEAAGRATGGRRGWELTLALLAATDWIASRADLFGLPLGVFGDRAGGGAALAAAAQRPHSYRALVVRDGTTHVTGAVLDSIRAATLLVVDGQDVGTIALNQDAMTRVRGIAELEIVPGLLDELGEPDAGQQVAWLARRWFARFLHDARATLDHAEVAS